MQNASISRAAKSVFLASAQENSRLAAPARQLRRLFGSTGNAARQDVLAATDIEKMAKTLWEDGNFAARVAYCKVEMERDGGRGG